MAKETKTAAQAAQPPPQYDWGQDQGAGFEHVTQSDLGIPFLGILQKLSPQVDETNGKYREKGIPGAKAGMIYDSLSNTVLWKAGEEPLQFVPCGFQKLFVEWKQRESGGGFVKVHRDEAILIECRKDERNRDVLRSGNLIATTAYYYGLLLIGGERKQYVIGMTSTQLRNSRKWINLMSALKLTGPQGKFTPPMFSHWYKLTTQLETKDQNSWFGWCINMGGMLTDDSLIGDARNISKLVAAGAQLALPNSSPEEDDEKRPFA